MAMKEDSQLQRGQLPIFFESENSPMFLVAVLCIQSVKLSSSQKTIKPPVILNMFISFVVPSKANDYAVEVITYRDSPSHLDIRFSHSVEVVEAFA
jgi:hypothetical protein